MEIALFVLLGLALIGVGVVAFAWWIFLGFS